ncbi:hypothetical protein C8R42DRAFT_644759 [Lentinula raphanica]|nr:hypothetical protein C8R42DRAFT_644759 [Lentinula raphanica]
MTRLTASRARALALLCLGAAISSSVLAVPVQPAPLLISSDPSLNGATPLVRSSQLMGQTSEVATPQRQADLGPHRDSGDLATVDDLEHDLGGMSDRPPHTSIDISVNLDHRADLSKRGDDDLKAKKPITFSDVCIVLDRLQADYKLLVQYGVHSSEILKLSNGESEPQMEKLFQEWIPTLRNILDYANKVPKLQVISDSTPIPERELQHQALENLAAWNGFISEKALAELQNSQNVIVEATLKKYQKTLSEMYQKEQRLLRVQSSDKYPTKLKKFVEEYRPRLGAMLSFARQIKAHPDGEVFPSADLRSQASDMIKSAEENLRLLQEDQQRAESLNQDRRKQRKDMRLALGERGSKDRKAKRPSSHQEPAKDLNTDKMDIDDPKGKKPESWS